MPKTSIRIQRKWLAGFIANQGRELRLRTERARAALRQLLTERRVMRFDTRIGRRKADSSPICPIGGKVVVAVFGREPQIVEGLDGGRIDLYCLLQPHRRPLEPIIVQVENTDTHQRVEV